MIFTSLIGFCSQTLLSGCTQLLLVLEVVNWLDHSFICSQQVLVWVCYFFFLKGERIDAQLTSYKKKFPHSIQFWIISTLENLHREAKYGNIALLLVYLIWKTNLCSMKMLNFKLVNCKFLSFEKKIIIEGNFVPCKKTVSVQKKKW